MFKMLHALAAAVALLVVAVFWLRQRGAARARRPPGPWGWPFVGNLLMVDPVKPYESLAQIARQFGPVCSLRLGSVPTVLLTDPEAIRRALSQDALSGRAPLYLTHGIMQGYGIICSEGDLWREQRKFTTNTLKVLGICKRGQRKEKMEHLLQAKADELVGIISSGNDDKPYHFLSPLTHCLGNIMSCLLFGKSWAQDDPTWDWLMLLQEVGTKQVGVAGPLNFLPILRFLPKFKSTMSFIMDGKIKTHKVYQKLVEDQERILSLRIASTGDQEPENVVQAFILERNRLAEAEASLNSPNNYCDEQLNHLLADLFGAGLDTTLATIRWFLLFMAMHCEEQEKVQAELDVVTEGGSRKPNLHELLELPYLMAAISETQRLRTVVPTGIPHGVVRDTEIGGFHVSKGTMVIPVLWAVHMDPDLFPDPESFKPARFLNDEGRYVKPQAFMPFQIGKRMCPGDELARWLLVVFGSALLANFRICLPPGLIPDLDGECGITLNPKTHPLVFRKRHVSP